MMISYQELVRTFPSILRRLPYPASELNHEDFYSRSSERPSRHGFRQRLERYRKPSGENPGPPIAVTPTVYDHLPTEWLLVPCKWALQGAGAVPGDLKAPS